MFLIALSSTRPIFVSPHRERREALRRVETGEHHGAHDAVDLLLRVL